MTDAVHLTLEEAVPLVTAVVARVAEAEGIRVLFVKGPSLAAMNLREPRASSDVDVLCDPRESDQLATALATSGWREYCIEFTGAEAIEKHATGLVHDHWRCSIDLHHMFPGFIQSHEVTFDALWERRVETQLAHQDVPVCDLAGAALVTALHLQRSLDAPWAKADREFMVKSLKSSMDAEALRDLAELAATCGAADTLDDFLDEVGAPAVGRGTTPAEALRQWRLRTVGGDTRGLVWVEELLHNPAHRWPGVVWRALTFDDQAHRAGHRQYSTRVSVSNLRHLARRSWMAVRYVPGAMRTWLRLRKSR